MFGLFHGNAHGFAIPVDANGIAYPAGFGIGTSTLHAVGALSALKLARWPGTIRAAGIATSLIGMILAIQTT